MWKPWLWPVWLLFSGVPGYSSDSHLFDLPATAFVEGVVQGADGTIYASGFAGKTQQLPKPLHRFGAAGSGSHAIVVKLNPDGTPAGSLAFGGQNTTALKVAVAPDGDVIVLGSSASKVLPVRHAVQARNAGGQDLFVAKFSADLSELRFATYLGGSGTELAGGLALDADGNIYVAAGCSADFLGTNTFDINPPTANRGGVAIVKLSPAGELIYSTRLNATSLQISALAVDHSGHAIVAGTTSGFDFPVTNAAQPFLLGYGTDAFVAKLSPDGRNFVFSTYLGGACQDSARAIAVNGADEIFVAGETCSETFPASLIDEDSASFFRFRGFVVKFTAAGEIARTTLLSHSDRDQVNSLAVNETQVYAGGTAGGSNLEPGVPFVSLLKEDGSVLSRFFPSACGHAALLQAVSASPQGIVFAASERAGLFAGGTHSYISRLDAAAFGEPQPPSVELLKPYSDLVFPPGFAIPFSVAILGAKTPVAAVNFYDGYVLIGTATNSPFTFTWSNSVPGTHPITAVAEINGTPLGSCVVPVTIGSPPNDAFTNRIRLRGETVNARGSLAGATFDAHEYPTYSSVWWEWIAPRDGVFEISVTGTNVSPYYVSVYSGTNLAALQAVSALTYGPRVTLQANRGVAYQIQINSFYAYAATDFRLHIRPVSPPANDSFANAQVLTGAVVQVQGTLRHATPEPSSGYDLRSTVWYSWTASASGSFFASIESATLYADVTVYQGSSQPGLFSIGSPVTGVKSGQSFEALVGAKYYLAVSSYMKGDFVLRIERLPQPVNDLFANAIELSGAPVEVLGTTLGAKHDLGEPTINYFIPGAWAWWTWTAPSSGVYRIDAPLTPRKPIASSGLASPRPGGYYDLLVFTGDSLSALVPVISTISDPGTAFRAEAGVAYQIAIIAGLSEFTLRIKPVDPPANDNFADAQPLSGTNVVAIASTFNATTEPGEPNTGGIFPRPSAPDPSIWYRWSAPEDGVFAISVSSPASCEIFSGDTLPSLTRVRYSDVRHVLRASAGQSYVIAVLSSSPFVPRSVLRIQRVTPPPNDDFANRQVLAGNAVSFIAETRNATREAGEQTYGSARGTVWFTWTAPASGTFLITRGVSSYEPVTVYTGDALGSLEFVSGNTYQTVEFQAESGVTYQFSVEDAGYYTGAPPPFTLVPATHPVNDDFANRLPLAGAPISLVASNDFATTEPDEPGQNYASVWWSWTAPRSGRVAIAATSMQFVPVANVFIGEALPLLVPVTAPNAQRSRVEISVEEGVAYQIAVGSAGYWSSPREFELTIGFIESPSNDAFENRRRLQRNHGSGTTLGASRQLGEPRGEADPYGASVWWTWRAPRSGVYDFVVTGAAEAEAIIYAGEQLSELAPVSTPPVGRNLYFRATAGTTYTIEVSNSNGNGGDYQLQVTRRQRPANDDFAHRIRLHGTNILVTGKNASATAEPAEPAHSYTGANRSVWWTWTAPAAGTAFIEFPPETSKYIAVYLGDNLPELIRVIDGSRRINFDVTPGTEYQIAIDVGYPDAPDPWQFRLSLVRPPANDNFASRITLPGNPVHVTGTVVGATIEEFEFTPGGSSHSVWWQWTAPESGRYTFRVVATNSFPAFALYTAESLDVLESGLVESVEGDQGVAEINFPVNAGDRFAIAIYGDIDTPTDAYQLNINKVPPPPNDGFANRAELVNGHRAGRNEGSSAEPGEPFSENPGFASVWWRFMAPSNGWYSLIATLSNETQHAISTPDTYLFAGESLTNLQLIYPDRTYPFPQYLLTADTEYAIQVSDYQRRIGWVELDLQYLLSPPNDCFTNAIEILGDHAQVAGSNTWATYEPDEPFDFFFRDDSVWWRWTPPSNGVYLLGFENSLGQYLALFSGTALSNLVRIPNVGYGAPSGEYLFRLQGGVTHYLRVTGGNRIFPTHFTLKLDRVEPPPNDDFANRTLLSGTHISLTASNLYATPEPGDPMVGTLGEQTVWWSWTAPSSGTATLDVYSAYGLHVGVFVGTELTNLTAVAGPIGTFEPITFQAQQGVSYQIGVTTWSYYAGEFDFTLDAPAAAPLANEKTLRRTLRLSMPAEGSAVIETSTNLIDWQPFRTNSLSERELLIVPRSDEGQRFFRVR